MQISNIFFYKNERFFCGEDMSFYEMYHITDKDFTIISRRFLLSFPYLSGDRAYPTVVSKYSEVTSVL